MLAESSSAYKYNISTRGILGGLFVGIATAVVCLVFDVVYRKITGYEFAEYININTIIFFTIPTLVVGGIAYSLIMQFVKKGLIVYMALCAVLTAVVAFIPLGPYMLPTGQPLPETARGLTLGIELITGAMGTFVLPYFAEHPSIWGD
jgi:O-antigen/teichoic acid export membrane protein